MASFYQQPLTLHNPKRKPAMLHDRSARPPLEGNILLQSERRGYRSSGWCPNARHVSHGLFATCLSFPASRIVIA